MYFTVNTSYKEIMMKNNLKVKFIWFLTFSPMVLAIISLFFLPEIIPTHFGIDGTVDSWGSKYSILVLPCISIFLSLSIKFTVGSSNNMKNKSIGEYFNTVFLVVFDLIFLIILIISLKGTKEIDSALLVKIIIGMLGMLDILIGNIMPKVKENHWLGIRTSWAYYNDVTWKKSQKVGGYSLIIVGIITILGALLIPNIETLIFLSVGAILLFTIFTVGYTYKIYRAEKYK